MNRVGLAALLLFLASLLPAAGSPETGPRITLRDPGGRLISPNNDGVRDRLRLVPELVLPDDRTLRSFTLTVYAADGPLAGKVVFRSVSETGRSANPVSGLLGMGGPSLDLPAELAWDGTFLASPVGTDTEPVPDGEYVCQIQVTDDAGAVSRTPPVTVTVDRAPPVIQDLSVSRERFSPDGDGLHDTVRILQEGRGAASWSARIVSEQGEPVRRFSWDRRLPGTVEWEGHTDAGVRAPDGAYRYLLSGRDAAGNTTEATSRPIRLSTATGDASLVADTQIISPNGDGVRDRLTLLPSLTAADDLESWELTVARAATPLHPSPSQRAAGAGGTGRSPGVVSPGAVALRLTGTEPPPAGIRIPAVASRTSAVAAEPANRDAAAERALEDGLYRAVLEVTYAGGAVVRSQPVEFTVDTVPPAGVVSADTHPRPTVTPGPLVFGGELRAQVRLRATLSGEAAWRAVVEGPLGVLELAPEALPGARVSLPRQADATYEDDGRSSESASASLPSGRLYQVQWDGRDANGNPLPDGTYAIRFEATDSAGNTGTTRTVRVVKDTRPARAALSLGRRAFSPDNDGRGDSLWITTGYEPPSGVESFVLSIRTPDGGVVRSVSGHSGFGLFEWTGSLDSGLTAPEGEYQAHLEVIYTNGNRATAVEEPIRVDTTPPTVRRLRVSSSRFSPDGDGRLDAVTFVQETSDEQLWRGTLRDAEGSVVLRHSWAGRAADFTWDGHDRLGFMVPDGEYTYELSAVDEAGNSGSERVGVTVDTLALPVNQRPPRVSLTASPLYFTPDGDGVDDRLTFSVSLEAPNPPASWELAIIDLTEEFRYETGGEGRPPAELLWDGRSNRGTLVDSGHEYIATIRVTDRYGNRAAASTSVRPGLILEEEERGLRIKLPDVVFEGRTSDLFSVSEPRFGRNLETLRSLSEVLRRYPDREILIEGHAAHEAWRGGPEQRREQREELVPLSVARAEEVRRALVLLGIEPDRMRTAGMGGARPIVPHSDRENVWKNRRVEFILEIR